MDHSARVPKLVALLFGLTAILAACDRAPDSLPVPEAEPVAQEAAETSPAPQPIAQNTAGSDGCYVHLFEDDDFEDDNIVVRGPGRFANLAGLPGTNRDWTDEAESFKVGRDATVTMWPDTNFRGTPRTFQPGSEVRSVDDEPESMEIRC